MADVDMAEPTPMVELVDSSFENEKDQNLIQEDDQDFGVIN